MKGRKAFQYLVCIDFQRTIPSENEKIAPEIIELSWSVYDTVERKTVEDFECYVKPSWTKEINTGTTKATGITQKLVANADDLAAVIKRLDHYLYVKFISENKTFCFICNGPKPLNEYLFNEAHEKGINLQAHFGRYFDIIYECSKCGFGQTTKNDINRLAASLQISTVNKRSQGFDACETLSAIASHLVRKGHVFSSPLLVQEPDDPTDESCSTSKLIPHSDQTPASPVEASRDSSKCDVIPDAEKESKFVRIRGLPWQATIADVQKFFSGLSIASNGVYIPLNFQGRPTGEAFIEFSSTSDAKSALSRHKSNMGHRYIEVFSSSVEALEAAKAQQSYQEKRDHSVTETGIVRMRGLPFSATVHDILHFFHGFDLRAEDVTFVSNREGRSTGEAYVEFPTAEIGREAMKRHHEKVGNRYIELFWSTHSDLATVREKARRRSNFPPVFHNGNLNAEVCIRMRGLPFSCACRDIEDFFANFGRIVVDGVHILYNRNERPTGEAYVEFCSPQDCEAAMIKDRSHMGHRYVELYRVTRGDMLRALGIEIQPQLVSNGIMFSADNPMGSVSVHMDGVGVGIPSHHLGNNMIGVSPAFQRCDGQQSMYFRTPPHPNNLAPAPVHGFQPIGYVAPPPPQFNHVLNGCVVKIRGLPFRTTIPEIIDFFRGYAFNQDSIRIALGKDGRPSGEAWIMFANSGEASRAVRDLHRRNLGSRWVELVVDS